MTAKPFSRIPGLLTMAMALNLSGCFFEKEDEPDYPPLNQAELIGCWYELDPLFEGHEECFDSQGRYFVISIDSADNPPTQGIMERLGTYAVEGRNGLKLTFESKILRTDGVFVEGYPITSVYSMSVVSDTLYFAGNSGLSGPRIRSDSTHNWRSHFRFFEKPDDWSLD